MLNCGVIGYGKMGQIRAQALRESGIATVASIYDPHPVALPASCRQAESPDEIINDEKIDAVFICTPNDLNEPLALQALIARKHVFCEKPPAFDAAGVERIRAAESASGGCVLMYGFNHRHHESIQRMKQVVEAAELGRILWMRGRYGKEVDEAFFRGWRADPARSGGGILIDQGVHMLDLMIYLAGDFDEVQAMVSKRYWKEASIEDNAFVNLRNSKSGVCASLHSTMTQWDYLFSFEVCLEDGALLLNGLNTSSGAYGEERLTIKRRTRSGVGNSSFESEQALFDRNTSWQSEVNHFLSSIQQGSPVSIGSSMDALRVMKVVDAIYTQSSVA